MFVRNTVAFDPPLHSGMIAMAQLAGYRANTASLADEFCIGHDAGVRKERTYVNVESVRGTSDYAFMTDEPTMGAKLRDLQRQSGRSYDEIAKLAGYKGRSSVQRYFNDDYEAAYLPRDIAEKLAAGFEGTKVGADTIWALAGLPVTNAVVQRFEGATALSLPRDLPIYGTALGAPRDLEGEAIEQTLLNRAEVIDYARRPTVLNGQKSAYGLYVQGVSMVPRYDDGDLIFITDGRASKPPSIGDHVVVYLRDHIEDDGERANAVMVKRLVRRNGSCIELEQYNPPLTFKLDVGRVLRIDRVIPWGELLS